MGSKRAYYLNGIGIISPQKTFDSQVFLSDVTSYDGNVLRCITPDFKAFINPIQLRRLSRTLRIGLSAAVICMRDAGVKMPDGIITATGYGFLEDTAKFLHEMLSQQEKQLTPTYFMQSTSNALAGLVALTIKCMGYNNTYASKGFAFENAITDAMMQLSDNPDGNLLVGAYDEAAEVQYQASLRLTHFKKEKINNFLLFDTDTKGSIQGEGVAFFMISGARSSSIWCVLRDLETYHQDNTSALVDALRNFLHNNDTDSADIDIVVNGASGDIEHDAIINNVVDSVVPGAMVTRFKHLSGEYTTSTAFALWLGASILKRQEVPVIVKANADRSAVRLEKILIVNQYLGKHFTFALLTRD